MSPKIELVYFIISTNRISNKYLLSHYIETLNYDISLTQSSESESSESLTDSETKPILRYNKKAKKKKENRNTKSIKWSKMEEFKLIKCVGNKTNLNDKDWIEIAKKFQHRSCSSLKRKYESLIKHSISPQRYSPRKIMPKHRIFPSKPKNNEESNDFDHDKFWNKYQNDQQNKTDQDEIEIIPNDKHEMIVNIEQDNDLKKLKSKIDIKCPLTQCIMNIAWKSTKCGHIFDKLTILNYIQQNQKYGTVICPIPGCSKKLRQNEWIKDDVAQNEIDKIKSHHSNDNRKRKRKEIEICISEKRNTKKRRLNNSHSL